MSGLLKTFGVVVALSVGIADARGQDSSTVDPYLWLEEVESPKALEWVAAQNAQVEAEISSTPEFKRMKSDLLEIFDSEERIPVVGKQGDWLYGFWRDKQNPRGVWRRTTLDEYRKAEPTWEVILDLDAINAAEQVNWVWKGARCLYPEYARCLVSLSRGGADATVVREFDVPSRTWVEGGFELPESKGGMSWIDRNSVFVMTDFGEGSLTESGYSRIVKRWERGTPLSAAKTLYEGTTQDMSVSGSRSHAPGFERNFIQRMTSFYSYEIFLLEEDDTLTRIDVPASAQPGITRDWMTVKLRDPWDVGGRTYPAGALLGIRFDDFMAGGRDFEMLFTPADTTSLGGYGWTKNHFVLNYLDDVKSRVEILTPGDGGWSRRPYEGLPEIGDARVWPTDSLESDALWIEFSDFLTPARFMLGDAGPDAGPPEVLKTLPDFFDASMHVAEQHFVTSDDGTRVPYFLVRQKDLAFDGTAPTLLNGYGGFEVSATPAYGHALGKAWLERGGVLALANIRGGGEYGPRWHQAALKQNRHRAYEDFAAVARDLIARRITSPAHLGIRGASNGGLLTGNMLVHYPELFGAIVIQVPLLDMQRYNKLLAGASWMAEYGNPDIPEEWEFIKTFSPYHLFDPGKDYPATMLLSSTRDDRVHPGHARKMHAMMHDAGKDVRYYENTEGGHGGAADNTQIAHMNALYYTFLWQQLVD